MSDQPSPLAQPSPPTPLPHEEGSQNDPQNDNADVGTTYRSSATSTDDSPVGTRRAASAAQTDDLSAETSATSADDGVRTQHAASLQTTLDDDATFGDLTLAQLTDRIVRAPLATLERFAAYVGTQKPPKVVEGDTTDAARRVPRSADDIVGTRRAASDGVVERTISVTDSVIDERDVARTHFSPSLQESPDDDSAAAVAAPQDQRAILITFFVRLVGLALAWIGTGIMAFGSIRTEQTALAQGIPFALVGSIIWGVTEFWRERKEKVLGSQVSVLSSETALRTSHPAPSFFNDDSNLSTQNSALGTRIGMGVFALLFGAGAFLLSSGNQFRLPGVLMWAACIVLSVWMLAPQGWSPLYPLRRWWAKWRGDAQNRNTDVGTIYRSSTSSTDDGGVGTGRAPSAVQQDKPISIRTRLSRVSWSTWALIAIVALGAVFRLTDIHGVPPEMTSDHVEKLLDSQRVYEGSSYNIFFQNNGGRESLQMYVMALFVRVTGLPMAFDTLKLLTALEGIITIPIMFWLGRELVGRHDRRLGIVVGLALAGLVAASYWHVALSRLALRIVYTPMITGLLFIYLSRALRDNRRLDFINAGLALGVALYMYQVARILPVVVVAGVALALVVFVRGWAARRAMIVNLLALVVVAFAVFIPLFRFSLDYPDDFWRRSSGRLFGDELTQVVNDDGTITERTPTIGERLTAFQANIPQLTINLRNALLMYTWKGDVAWINGAPNRPAFDALSGALLVVGLGGWLGWMLRKRDAALWLVLPALLILILPSALAIAYPIENPSATRMSGTLPFAYLFAAFGLGVLVYDLWRAGGLKAGASLAMLAFVGVIGFSYSANSETYFTEYRQSYTGSSKPYTDVGRTLRLFVGQGGAYGNAFMVGYPYWWDHRAIGIEAGRLDYPNGILTREGIPLFMRESANRVDEYRFDPNLPILFIYSPDDIETELLLQQWFPSGRAELVQTYQLEDSYRVFRVPPLGMAAFEDFVAREVQE